MAEQYEMVWRSGSDFFSRTRDTDTNKVSITKIDPEWEFYERTKDGTHLSLLDKSVQLQPRMFNDQKSMKEYTGMMDTLGREVYGGQRPEYHHIRKHFWNNNLVSKMRIWFFDIEVIEEGDYVFPDAQIAAKPVTQIQIYDSYTDKIIILSLDAMKEPEKFKKWGDQLVFKHHESEKSLFKDFFKLLDALKPTVITAWGGNNFDFPYITHRAMQIDGINHRKLSPINKVSEMRSMGNDKNYKWEGLYLIDMMEAYKKFTFAPQTSYSLDNISKVELGIGEGKVDYGEFDNIVDFHDNDIDKFLEYSIMDVVSLKKLEDKIKLISLMQILSVMMGCNMVDSLGTVNPWTQYLTNLGYQKNLVMPYNKHGHLDKTIVGGYVRDPAKGKHEWLASIDVNSMYPLLGMRAFNMSPETYIEEYKMPDEMLALRKLMHCHENEDEYLNPSIIEEIKTVCHKYDVAYGMNAFFMRDEEGIIPERVADIYSTRKEAKRRMLMYKAFKAKLKAV